MIKKICLIVVFVIISVVMMAVTLGASKYEVNKECTLKTSATEDVVNDLVVEDDKPIIKTEVTIEDKKPTYTEDDLYYLAAAVCREAGGAPEEVQLLVANVVINRVNSSVYPDTIYDVLTQYKQYGTMWKHGISFPDWANQKIIDNCYEVARRVLDGERFCPDNVLFQAEFKQGSGVFKEFDGYYFCYYG